MATTWIKPIHVNKGKTAAQTLQERSDYAKNPEKTADPSVTNSARYATDDTKTAGGKLVRSYGCEVASADAEFLVAKREYETITGRSGGRGNVLAYHIRQSFKPGEITPGEALDVGYELVKRFTKGKHAFIVAVHTDRKHIHCHALFNSTNLNRDGKFKNFLGSSFAIRRLSDLICLEHGLSVIESPKQSKNNDYGAWIGEEKRLSFRSIICRKLDEILPDCTSFSDLYSALRVAGFTVSDRRKHITISAPGQKRPTRLKSLGKEYTEDALRARFGRTRTVSGGGDSGTQSRPDMLIDIQAKIREGKGGGFEHWAHLFNIKQTSKTLFFLRDNGITDYEDLVKRASETCTEFDEKLAKIKAADARLSEIAELQKHIGVYSKTREIYRQYRASGWSKEFYEERRADIVLHRAAKRHFDSLGLSKLPTIAALKQEYAATLAEKKALYVGYHELKQKRTDFLVAKGNVGRILGIDREEQNRAPSRTTTRRKTRSR